MSAALSIALIAGFGAAGALVRLFLNHIASSSHRSVLYATVTANALGSLGAGLVLAADWGAWSWLLATGLFGATSTLSTLAVDVAELLRRGGWSWLRLVAWHTGAGLASFGIGSVIGGVLG